MKTKEEIFEEILFLIAKIAQDKSLMSKLLRVVENYLRLFKIKI